MEQYSLKLIAILLINFTLFYDINCCRPHKHIPSQNQTNIETTFVYNSNTIKVGDQLECNVTSVNVTPVDITNRRCDTHIFLQDYTKVEDFVYLPVSKDMKCFSFKVRSDGVPSLLLSHTSKYIQPDIKYQVVIDLGDKNYIANSTLLLTIEPNPSDMVNNQELKPFWIRYINNLIEVGKGTENVPFLKHQFTEADGLIPSVDYMAISTVYSPSEWIIDADPVCGINNSTATPTPTQHQVKTAACKVKTGRPSGK